MTRINLVPVDILSDVHLIAEWHEIGRVATLAKRWWERQNVPSRSGLPKSYKMGDGHVKFFFGQLRWIRERIDALAEEMQQREFKTDCLGIYKNNLDLCNSSLLGSWHPDLADLLISIERLIERSPENKIYVGFKRGAEQCL